MRQRVFNNIIIIIIPRKKKIQPNGGTNNTVNCVSSHVYFGRTHISCACVAVVINFVTKTCNDIYYNIINIILSYSG